MNQKSDLYLDGYQMIGHKRRQLMRMRMRMRKMQQVIKLGKKKESDK